MDIVLLFLIIVLVVTIFGYLGRKMQDRWNYYNRQNEEASGDQSERSSSESAESRPPRVLVINRTSAQIGRREVYVESDIQPSKPDDLPPSYDEVMKSTNSDSLP
ncbi:hypothetical protein QR680_004645 [Steinernema hermaphroditum]|uniref:Uncharacterized protein n=1 Tax=Steinernema hermaphroditum TaxID=289476 RepID=A0AA39HPC4_9BILA|nr:hypothetical protein QR680_004645 [Steinernema hermaphroditum]